MELRVSDRNSLYFQYDCGLMAEGMIRRVLDNRNPWLAVVVGYICFVVNLLEVGKELRE